MEDSEYSEEAVSKAHTAIASKCRICGHMKGLPAPIDEETGEECSCSCHH
jgi:hypothetical protein